MRNRRLFATAVAVVALALTVLGVVLAATDPNPGGVTGDPLALHGFPPRTAHLVIAASTSTLQATADLTIDFRNGGATGVATVGLTAAGEAFDVVLSGRHLYLRSAAESSGPWYQVATPALPFFGLSLELTKPDLALISGYHSRTVTHDGYLTTYTYDFAHAALTPLFAGRSTTSRLGTVDWSITVGSEGEVTASTLRVSAGGQTSTLSATVQAYNAPRFVVIPSVGPLAPVAPREVAKLLHSAGLGAILLPRGLLSGAPTTVN